MRLANVAGWGCLGILGACSQGATDVSGRCGKTASVTTVSSQAASLYRETRAVGGYLVAHHAPDMLSTATDEASLIPSYCAATVERDPSVSTQVVVWTAAHCIDYSRLVKLQLVRYDASAPVDGFGTYRWENSLDPVARTLASVRAQARIFPESVARAVLGVFANPAERAGTKWCKDFTAARADEAAQQICTSLDDMELVRFALPEPSQRSADVNALVAALDAIPPIQSASVRQKIVEWQTAYRHLSEARTNVIYARLKDVIRGCAPGATSEICRNAAAVETFLGLAFAEDGGVANRSELTEAKALETFVQVKGNVRSLWRNSVLGGATTGILDKIHVEGSFRFADALPAAAVTPSPLQIAPRTAFLGLPFLYGMSSAESQGVSVVFGGEGILLNRPKNHAVMFVHGDSGTIVSFKPTSEAFFPLGVISTVDGEPTSGGLAMRPTLNTDEDDKSGGSGGAGTVSEPTLKGTPVAGDGC